MKLNSIAIDWFFGSKRIGRWYGLVLCQTAISDKGSAFLNTLIQDNLIYYEVK